MTEALLYLPYVELPSDDHRILSLKAWKSYNSSHYVESSHVLTNMKKENPRNWELYCLDGLNMIATGKPTNEIKNQYDQAFALIQVKKIYTWRQLELMRNMLNYFQSIGDNDLYQKYKITFDRVSTCNFWHDFFD